MILTQKDLILAIGPHRHLSLPEITHAVCLQKNYGRFRRRIFCNIYWMLLLVLWLMFQGRIERYAEFEKEDDGKVKTVNFDRPRYRLTSLQSARYPKIYAERKTNSPRWVSGS